MTDDSTDDKTRAYNGPIQPPPLPRPGIRLPSPYAHLELLKRAGAGGFGEVYSALADGRHDRAVKFLSIPEGCSQARFDALLDEAEFGREARSPHLGHTFGVLRLRDHPGWPALALEMQWYPCSLKQVIEDCERKGDRFPAQQIVTWTRDLAKGLDAFHRDHHRVHRDIKPSNIMFSLPKGERYTDRESLLGAKALLTDFGVAGPRDGQSFWPLRRDRWKDPELFPEGVGVQDCTTPMDLYSFGKVLLEFCKICDGPTDWLEEVANVCLGPATDRPPANELVPRLSIDWNEQYRLIRDSGWSPEDHRDFVGREFIFEGAFSEFLDSCGDSGGVFLIEGSAGVGKTALLTNWAARTEQPLGYYFRYRDNRTDADEMPRRLAQQLRHQYDIDEEPGQEELSGLLDRLCREIAKKAEPEQLLLFIDGIDESRNPTEAVGYIPKTLPKGIYIIASSRPPKETDYLASLRNAGATIFPLRPDHPKNLADVTLYFERQLGAGISAGQAETLAGHTGGIFLLAKYLVEAILGERMTLAEAMEMASGWAGLDPEDRLMAYYRETWGRLCEENDSKDLATFAALLTAVFGWVSEDFLDRILDRYFQQSAGRTWGWERTHELCRVLAWFLDQRVGEQTQEPSFQLRHQSVRDFFVFPGGAGSPAGPVSSSGLLALHASIGSYFLDEVEHETRGWFGIEPYGRFFTPRHLIEASENRRYGRLSTQAFELLTSPEYLHATLGDEPEEALASLGS